MIKTRIVELKDLFQSLGLKKNDAVFIHSSLFSLGIIENGIEGFHKALIEVVGREGTIIVPTFTYSFRRNQIFDIQNTPSAKNLSIYSEFIRNDKNAIRSSDPLFSMAAIGPNAKKLMARNSFNCFGENSIYEKIFEQDIKFLCIGITYSTGLSAFMHLEKKSNIPYRKDLKLKGTSKDIKGKEFNDCAIHFAKDETFFQDAKTDRENIGNYLEKTNISKSLNFKYGKHFLIKAKNFEHSVLEKLYENPFCMIKKNKKL